MAKIPNYVVFDIETGGLFTKEHKYGICEIAAIAIHGETLEELGRFDKIIAPYKTYSGELTEYTPGAFEVHKIPTSTIEEGEDAKKTMREFVKFLNNYKSGGAPILVGHNILSFDIPYLAQLFDLMKIDPSKSTNKTVFDSLVWARSAWCQGELPNHKLGTCCQHIGYDIVDAHRAMADVEGNAELLKFFIKNLRGAGSITKEKVERPRVNYQF